MRDGGDGSPRWWGRWLAAAVAMAALACAFGACGDDGASSDEVAERDAVIRAVRAMQRSFAEGAHQSLCARMDATARRQAGEVAHGQPDGCVKDLSQAFDVIDKGHGLSGARGSRVAAVEVTGRDATATVALEGHGSVDVPLTRGPMAWRLATFFGTPPRQARAAAIAARRAPFPPAGRAVAVTDGAGLPCFPLFDEDYPQVAGGCELRAFASRIQLSVGTPLGHFRFGECELAYRVMADERGRAWTDGIELRGPDNVNNGCSDVQGCENAAGEPLPWRGRISATADGRFVHRMDTCLDTCVGFYVGSLTIELSEGPGGWRARAVNAGVGESGLRFDGGIGLKTDGFALVPSHSGD